MLHGWAQNSTVFSNRSRKLTKRLTQEGYRVVFLQAPHRLPPINPATSDAGDTSDKNEASSSIGPVHSREYAYAWFLYDSNDPTDNSPRSSPTGDYRGMTDSLQVIHRELQELNVSNLPTERIGPPVAILGFSQGAVMAHKVASLASGCMDLPWLEHRHSCWRGIKKYIIVSGFSCIDAASTARDRESTTKLSNHRVLESLHVIGRQDGRVPQHLSRHLYAREACFGGIDKAILWEHDRGHVIPQNKEFCTAVLDFLGHA